MRTLGVIGGLGPETTSEFYLAVVAQCQRLARAHRPDILFHNVPITYGIEEDALLHGNNVEAFLPYLQRSAQQLEKAGAEFLVMPCNTLHRFARSIQESVSIPFISLVDVVIEFIKTNQLDNIGLIATSITLESGFYQQACAANRISYALPSAFHQAKLAKMILGLVSNSYANHHRNDLIDVIDDFDKQGIKNVLLACTDLQALIPHHPRIKIVDTMQLLVDRSVKEICTVSGT